VQSKTRDEFEVHASRWSYFCCNLTPPPPLLIDINLLGVQWRWGKRGTAAWTPPPSTPSYLV